MEKRKVLHENIEVGVGVGVGAEVERRRYELGERHV